MTAYLADEETQRLRQLSQLSSEQSPEEYLLKTIQSYMENNQTHYATDELLSVSYAGPNTGEIQQNDPEISTRPIDASNIENKEGYPGSKYIGISVASIFIVVLLMGLIYSYREKKRKEKERKTRENDNPEMENRDGDIEAIVGGTSQDGDDHDDALPPLDSMAATDGDSSVDDDSPAKSLSKDSMMPYESSLLPPLDLHESPSDDMLYGKDDESAESQPIDRVFSDAESQPMVVSEDHPEHNDDDSNIYPPRLVEEDSISRDSNSSNEVDTNWGGYADNTLDTTESTNADVNLSPSEATERMGNTAPLNR